MSGCYLILPCRTRVSWAPARQNMQHQLYSQRQLDIPHKLNERIELCSRKSILYKSAGSVTEPYVVLVQRHSAGLPHSFLHLRRGNRE